MSHPRIKTFNSGRELRCHTQFWTTIGPRRATVLRDCIATRFCPREPPFCLPWGDPRCPAGGAGPRIAPGETKRRFARAKTSGNAIPQHNRTARTNRHRYCVRKCDYVSHRRSECHPSRMVACLPFNAIILQNAWQLIETRILST